MKIIYKEDQIYYGINLSRNWGRQIALFEGLMFVKEKADMVISLNTDLQDDIDVIDRFIDEHFKGRFMVKSNKDQDFLFRIHLLT